MTANRWLQMIEENPGHSAWYIERWRTMAAEGNDLDGEARCIDAMAARNSTILDAGCGTGRVGGRLAHLGHTVVGVDLDPELIAAAHQDFPESTWIAEDLSTLNLAAHGLDLSFDLAVCAGNVMTFLDPTTRRSVLERVAAHLKADGRFVVGFGANRGYGFQEFFDDATATGLHPEVKLSTWDLRPFTGESDFLVAVLAKGA